MGEGEMRHCVWTRHVGERKTKEATTFIAMETHHFRVAEGWDHFPLHQLTKGVHNVAAHDRHSFVAVNYESGTSTHWQQPTWDSFQRSFEMEATSTGNHLICGAARAAVGNLRIPPPPPRAAS